MSQQLSYCAQVVQANDPDRFLAGMLMPAAVREDLWPLFAFNYEIAKTREVVTETTLGLIRLQWWRDALAAIYEGGDAPQHEIVQPLAAVIEKHDLPREWLDGLVYGREFDLEGVPPANMEGLHKYAEFTSGPLIRLAVKVAGEDTELPKLTDIAKAYALTGLMRSVAFHAGQERCYLPDDLMKEAGFDQYGVGKEQHRKAVRMIVEHIAFSAEQLLPPSRHDSRFARITAKMAALYLKQLKGLGYDVFDGRVEMKPPFFHLKMMFS